MTSELPILPTSVIGSYAWPSWLHTALAAAKRGEYGPADMKETQDDAVAMAVRDQDDADIDIITDGEMRRVGFFTAEFYGHLTGLHKLQPQRMVGIIGHDQRESYEVMEPITCPKGLGLVAEYSYVQTRTTRRVKVPCPGSVYIGRTPEAGCRLQRSHRGGLCAGGDHQ